MAAEQDLKLDSGSTAAEADSAGGKKKLILIIVGVILLLAAAAGAAFFFLSGGEEEAAGETAEPAAVEAEPVMPVQYVILKPEFVVSFQVGQRQRFLQVNIEVMTRKQNVVDALTLHDPMIRNTIIRIIGEQNFEHLRTAEGRIELQQQLLQNLSALLKREAGVDGVEAVLFTDFVMQ